MEDTRIIDLYLSRSPQAISETERKYGKLCRSIAGSILKNWSDAEECVNDTYLAVWNAIPPHEPRSLVAFLAKITRRIAINRYFSDTTQKRGGGQVPLTLEELREFISTGPGVEEHISAKQMQEAVNRFLAGLPENERNVFLRRYFLMDPVKNIAVSFGFSEGKVSSMLHRTRKKLRTYLEMEGYL